MHDSTRTRFLWAALLTPPILVLACVVGLALWPQQTDGVMDLVARVWAPAPPPPPQAPLADTHSPTPPNSPPPPAASNAPTWTTLRLSHPDGSPFEEVARLSVRSISRGGQSTRGYGQKGPVINVTTPGPWTWIMLQAHGYAPVILRRPLTAPDDAESAEESDDEISVVFNEGFSHRVRVVDAASAPIPWAKLHLSLTLDDHPVRLEGEWLTSEWFTDEDGWITIPHASDDDYEIDVTLYDFLTPDDTVFFHPEPGADTTIKLDRGSLNGLVVDEEGRPVADTPILLAAEYDPASKSTKWPHLSRVVLAMSDADGRFVLPRLHRNSVHLIEGQADDGSRGYAQGVRLDGPEPRLTLHPRHMVHGLLKPPEKGPPWLLPSVKQMLPAVVDAPAQNAHPLMGGRTLNTYMQCDAEGRFEFPVWSMIEAELHAGGRVIPITWPPPEEPIVIDDPLPQPRPEPAERWVRVRLSADASLRPINASMTFLLQNGSPAQALPPIRRLVDLQDGQGAFLTRVGEAYYFESSAIPGLWTSPGSITALSPPGDRAVEVRAFAAGSISGQVVDADGAPIGKEIAIRVEFDPDWAAYSLPDRPAETNLDPTALRAIEASSLPPVRTPMTLKTDADGRFTIPSWPLTIGCRLVVGNGHWEAASELVRPDAATPHRVVSIQAPRRRSVEVRIVDPEGLPVADAPIWFVPGGERRNGWECGPTDADGRATITDVLENEQGSRVLVNFTKDFVPITKPLPPGAAAMEIQVERGRTLEGRLVEAITNWPFTGKSLSVQQGDRYFHAEAHTDDEGRFRFSNLPDGTVEVSLTTRHYLAGPKRREFRTGTGEPVLIHWSDFPSVLDPPKPPARRNGGGAVTASEAVGPPAGPPSPAG